MNLGELSELFLIAVANASMGDAYVTTTSWVCTYHTFLVWLILGPTRTMSRFFSPALLPRICWPPRELDIEGWHSQRERSGKTRWHCLWRVGFLEVSQQSHLFIKTWFNVQCIILSAREKATHQKIQIKNRERGVNHKIHAIWKFRTIRYIQNDQSHIEFILSNLSEVQQLLSVVDSVVM